MPWIWWRARPSSLPTASTPRQRSGFERSGVDLGGTAARVLDYSAVWAHADGSSRLLEHEIIRVQSAEAIGDMAEQPLRAGVFLKLRVRKKDGRVLEPELVSGKPTVTMPHLEIGDYIETERIESNRGDGRHGASYVGPRWFFREENVSYARSEFVVISPVQKQLQIETKNDVPPPQVTERDGLVVRRWRVDHSPAAAVEPFGAPISEFLPSVQVGWGISLDATLRALADSADDLGPVDPRIRRIAERIVEPLPPSARSERARKLYRWITANVEEGQESDGRRVVVGKNGNLWRGYLTLCRALGIQADYAVVQNRLTLPPSGPFSSALVYTQPLLRVRGDKGEQWLTLGSKHAAFGYLPAEVRGMPAVVFTEKGPEKAQTPAGGALDNPLSKARRCLPRTGPPRSNWCRASTANTRPDSATRSPKCPSAKSATPSKRACSGALFAASSSRSTRFPASTIRTRPSESRPRHGYERSRSASAARSCCNRPASARA